MLVVNSCDLLRYRSMKKIWNRNCVVISLGVVNSKNKDHSDFYRLVVRSGRERFKPGDLLACNSKFVRVSILWLNVAN